MSFNTELTKQLDLSMEVLLHVLLETLNLQTTGLINGRCPLTLNLPKKQWKMSYTELNKQLDLSKMSFNTELEPNNWAYQWKMSFNTELDKQLDLSMEDVLNF